MMTDWSNYVWATYVQLMIRLFNDTIPVGGYIIMNKISKWPWVVRREEFGCSHSSLLQLTPWNKDFLEKQVVTELVKKTPCLLKNLNDHYHIHKSLPLVPILSQMNLDHSLKPCFFKIDFNVIPPSMCTTSKWSVPFRVPTKILNAFSICTTCHIHLILYLIILIFGEEFKL
jgi:hypothetical protein